MFSSMKVAVPNPDLIDIRASLGLSSNWGGLGLFGSLPWCKEADLIMADRSGPRSCWRGGRGQTSVLGLTMAILNKSGKKIKECKSLQFIIYRDSVPRSLQRLF